MANVSIGASHIQVVTPFPVFLADLHFQPSDHAYNANITARLPLCSSLLAELPQHPLSALQRCHCCCCCCCHLLLLLLHAPTAAPLQSLLPWRKRLLPVAPLEGGRW
jgi:hypothetical protein